MCTTAYGLLTQECELQTMKYTGEHATVTLDIKEWKFARKNFILPIPSGRMNVTSSHVIRRTAVRQTPSRRRTEFPVSINDISGRNNGAGNGIIRISITGITV